MSCNREEHDEKGKYFRIAVVFSFVLLAVMCGGSTYPLGMKDLIKSEN